VVGSAAAVCGLRYAMYDLRFVICDEETEIKRPGATEDEPESKHRTPEIKVPYRTAADDDPKKIMSRTGRERD
jgi:hypothetical protein